MADPEEVRIWDLTEELNPDRGLSVAVGDNVDDVRVPLSVIMHGVSPLEFGADPTGVADSTAAIQAAIDAARTADTTSTWSQVSGLSAVLIPFGDYLITAPLRIPEGVHIYGISPTATRLLFNFDGYTDGITAVNTDGLTFTKNFGVHNLALMADPDGTFIGPYNFMHFVYAIEPQIHNVRVIQHLSATGGGNLAANAINLEKCINVDIDNVVVDGGYRALYANDQTLVGASFALRNSRIRNLFCFNQRDQAIYLIEGASDNQFSNIYYERATLTGGTPRIVAFDNDLDNLRNTVVGITARDYTAEATAFTTGVNTQDCLFSSGTIDGFAAGGAIAGTNVRLRDINFVNTLSELIDGTHTPPDRVRGDIVRQMPDVELTLQDTWYAFANVRLPSTACCYAKMTVVKQIEGVGRRVARTAFAVVRGSGSPTITEDTGVAFVDAAGYEFRAVEGSSTLFTEFQIRRTLGGDVTPTSVGVHLDLIAEDAVLVRAGGT